MTEYTKTAISHQPLLQTEDHAANHDKRRIRTICKQCKNSDKCRKKRLPRHPVVEMRASGIRLNIYYQGKRYRITLCQRTRCKPCAQTPGDHDDHSTPTMTTGMTDKTYTTPEHRHPASNCPSHNQG